MKIFETHAHLDFSNFNKDREDLIRKCFQSGIEYIINIGIDETTSRAGIELAGQYERIYATVGFHPHDADKFEEKLLRSLIMEPKVVGIGEIGLDYYRNYSPPDLQKKVFQHQVEIAVELDYPIVIHDREAHEDCWDILKDYNPHKVVFHCFSGDYLFASRIVDQGWLISVPGTITYKNNQLQEVVRNLPIESIMIETDSPFLSPIPVRRKRNSPLNLRYIIEKIAEIKGLSPNHVAEKTYENAVEFFLSHKKRL